MKLEKKAFTIVEILVYIITISIILLVSYNIMTSLIIKMEEKKERQIFFNNYNNFVSSILENTEKWWSLHSTNASWIILENNWKYMWYACEDNGIYQTPISSWYTTINWNIKENYFSWYNCNELTWKANVYSWFFIKVNILEDQEYKYFLKTNIK